MQLSNRASKYIGQLHRDLDYTCNRELTESYLRASELPAFEPVIKYQTEISGLTLVAGPKDSRSLTASLFLARDIETNVPLETVQIDQKHYFFCGNQPTAPFTFLLAEDGEICSYDGYGDEVNPIYSSGESMIENFALLDYLSKDAVELPQYFELIATEGFEQIMAGHGRFSRANDKYNSWYVTDKVVVQKGTWLDKPEHFVHIYSKSSEEANKFYSLLKKEKIIS